MSKVVGTSKINAKKKKKTIFGHFFTNTLVRNIGSPPGYQMRSLGKMNSLQVIHFYDDL